MYLSNIDPECIFYDGIVLIILYGISQYMFSEAINLIVKNRHGEVRLVWKIIILFIASNFISSLIKNITTIFIHGPAKEEFMQLALRVRPSATNLESSGWAVTIGMCIYAASIIFAVWFMIIKLERRTLSLKELGLDWRKSSTWHIGLGILLAILYILLLNPFLSELDRFSFINTYIAVRSVDTVTAIRLILMVIPAAFAEEILFRAYLQSRMTECMGIPLGILTTTVVFILMHFPSLKSIVIFVFHALYAIVFWFFAGYLYYRNRSLYFVGLMHSALNVLLVLSHIH